jgi:hypothetical protein
VSCMCARACAEETPAFGRDKALGLSGVNRDLTGLLFITFSMTLTIWRRAGEPTQNVTTI